ncbi:hypothetical protein [Serpentinimonas maccroryi]|uniref:hypothetical protein n=1 Tax=Serpentinimonas maccroryi TaxID=1458426 RepID=UPI002033C1B7|nr:hypothetical protein [Serpentinimonas maccroryi]MCM2480188.1 hypothetical protein [Serpentinimonas maccroryi]
MNEIDRVAFVEALELLTEELRCLRMEQTVQRTALALLARHLSVLGHAQLEVLAQDLEAMGSTQAEPGWQDGFAQIAGVLRLMHARPSRARSRSRPVSE